MNMLTTVTTKGQVTIPEAVRRALGVSVGDKVVFSDVVPEKKHVTMKIVSSDDIEDLFGSLKTSVGYVPHKKAREIAARYLGKRYKR